MKFVKSAIIALVREYRHKYLNYRRMILPVLVDFIGLISCTVLNVRKHIFEQKHRKSSRNFSLIVNK